MGAILAFEPDASTTIPFLRPKTRGSYSEDEARFLISLVPHLQATWDLRRRLELLDVARGSMLGALDALGYGLR